MPSTFQSFYTSYSSKKLVCWSAFFVSWVYPTNISLPNRDRRLNFCSIFLPTFTRSQPQNFGFVVSFSCLLNLSHADLSSVLWFKLGGWNSTCSSRCAFEWFQFFSLLTLPHIPKKVIFRLVFLIFFRVCRTYIFPLNRAKKLKFGT